MTLGRHLNTNKLDGHRKTGTFQKFKAIDLGKQQIRFRHFNKAKFDTKVMKSSKSRFDVRWNLTDSIEDKI